MTATVTVMALASSVDLSACASSITTQKIQSLPLQERSLQGLFILSPGVASPGPGDPLSPGMMNMSSNGQRPTANQFTLDGVNANFGIATGGQSPGASASGGMPALTSTGGASSLVSGEAVQEVTIRTSGRNAEDGRNPGALVAIVTKSGTNDFRGSAFYFFNHEGLDAHDWFGNSRGLSKPPHRLNNFSGTLGGPIQRDRTFFFLSYDGFRLRQPVIGLTDVPSLNARQLAPANTQPLLNLYPLPTGRERPDGFAEFAASFANAARHEAVSLRIDNAVNPSLMLSARINVTDSSARERGAGGFSLNTLNHIFNRAESVTGTANYTMSPVMIGEFRANYSRFRSRSFHTLDDFGGAVLLPESRFSQSAFFSQDASFTADLDGRSARLSTASGVTNVQHQMNLVGSITRIVGNHTIKFGADYRRLSPTIRSHRQNYQVLFDGVAGALAGQAARLNVFTHTEPQRPVFNQFSAYGQDEWKVTTKLTFDYGLRWELSPPPSTSDGRNALAVSEFGSPSQLTLAPAGSSLWSTTYGNLAPRVGFAYQPFGEDFVIRGGFGILYDTANRAVGDTFTDSYPFQSGQSQANAPFSFGTALTPPTSTTVSVPFSAFDPHLKLPYTMEWNLSLQRAFGRQTITAGYVGTAGRRLLLTNTLLNQNPNFEFLRLTDNAGSSKYDSLQLLFHRRYSAGLSAMASYTWARSRDNFSEDSAARALFRSNDARFERGPSNYDIRHSLNGFVTYDIPDLFAKGFGKTLFHNWGIDANFSVRSASPVDVVYAIPTGVGFIYLRPDVIEGVPLYLPDAAAAGGRRINAAAFAVPADLRQGTLARNTLRGFPLWQLNLGLRRRFNFTEDVRLVISMTAANIFNHPDFASPDSILGVRFQPGSIRWNSAFGQSFTHTARSASGIPGSSFGANYYPGGPRSLTLSARLEF